ncbi:formylglycine-generating enzyme family protein [Lewinella sp. IMCC34183]|uniref:formylglycine-generating enzyme family protein n=1 Tax=Lewinella sp. IMCC34183 TaxID=2248762 RepID=UPI000E2884BF|nr:SUMF1/EgtB/PvdO family nonheme iron enzyme [Lewinella sp. IMCC34183]
MLSFLFAHLLLLATTPPQPFRDLSRELHPGPYYGEQTESWRRRATDDCADDNDWLQYFLYARYANRFDHGTYDLAEIERMALAHTAPEGFAANYLRYMQADIGRGRVPLMRAYAAEPENPYALSSVLGYAMLEGDTALARTVSERIDRLFPYPAGLLDFNYNTLVSVAPNGILLTFGDADTYPAWVLQRVHGVRNDVLVVNYHLFNQLDDYASLVFRAAGVAPPPTAHLRDKLERLRQSRHPLHVAATVGDRLDRLELPQSDLYPTGLVFRVSDAPVENLAVTRRLYREEWRLDRLRLPLSDSPADRVSRELAPNYLVSLIELVRQDRQGNDQPDEALRSLIDTIARAHGLTARVAGLLGEGAEAEPQLASREVALTAAELFDAYAYGSVPRRPRGREGRDFVPDYFMKEKEVANGEYQLFLEDLLRQKKYDYLDSARSERVDWLALLPDSLSTLPEAELYVRGRPEAADHPVVNISHRGAELYAYWLTQVYNQDPKREGGRNVRFRLPTAAEFERAARGGKQHAPYPWGGPDYRNARGCILANLNATLLDDDWTRGNPATQPQLTSKDRERGCRDDGALLTAPTDSYYPNDFGLYNMSGNAAEMIDVPGQTMGGSWRDGPEALRIGVITERTLPSPTTGFRLVMEYVD